MTDTIKKYSEAFDKLMEERHAVGAAEYGHFTFLGNDVVRMMMEELADTANYCRMQFIKLMMLQHVMEDTLGEDSPMGAQAFKGTSEVGWGRE